MVLEIKSLHLLEESLSLLEESFAGMPAFSQEVDMEGMREVMQRVATRMQDNFPYPHPLYAGQMLKPPHPIARLAYTLSLWVNPNNHALDGGRASSEMEKEAVAEIASMFGWKAHLGHLTGGGTLANLEALWVAGKLQPGKKIVASEQAHYTHSRISEVLKLPFQAASVDDYGRLDVAALEVMLQRGEVGTVVVTLGTTGVGAVDPLDQIVALQERYDFRIHVDAAYGGYFRLAENLSASARRAYEATPFADSIVVDPHKHGLQPYGCGCILFRDPSVGQIYKHDSPYTYFSSEALHLGEISLECSRAGASAVALWATQQLLPMAPGGAFAKDLTQCREAALALYSALEERDAYLTVFPPELDIVIWAPKRAKASDISAASQRHFDEAASRHLHLALMQLPAALMAQHCPEIEMDTPMVSVLRSCLMKPEHHDWLAPILQILDQISALPETK